MWFCVGCSDRHAVLYTNRMPTVAGELISGNSSVLLQINLQNIENERFLIKSDFKN